MTAANPIDTIARKHTTIHQDPRGFRVLTGATVLGWWSCYQCPARLCDCHDRASKLLRKSGAPARLETLDGTVLAHMKSSAPAGRPVRMLSLAEHRAQPRVLRSVGDAVELDVDVDEPTDEPGGDDVELEESGDDE